VNSTPKRVLVIGLDGATFAILAPLLEEGKLPNLRTVQESGSWSTLLSTIPPFTAPAWVSFATGANPGRHGAFDFFERDLNSYIYDSVAGFVHADVVQVARIWDILSRSGKRVGVINVPLTYPPSAVNGIMVTGMLTPPGARNFVYPPEILQEMGDYVVDLDHGRDERGFVLDAHLSAEELLARVNHMLERRTAYCLRFLRREPWDFFMVVFVGTDRLFHELWHYLDPECEAYASKRAPIIRQGVEEYLSGLDSAIGELMAACGDDTVTFIMSDHGFGPAPTKRLYLNEWLSELGLLRDGGGADSLLKPEFWATRLGLRRPSVKSFIERVVSFGALQRAKGDRSGKRELVANWSQTRAFGVHMYNHVCGIVINLRGRNKRGIVEPGAEYEALQQLLMDRAMELEDPATGERLVRKAYRRQDVYEGPHLDKAPDVVLVLHPDYVGAAPLGSRTLVAPHSARRQGDHRREGILLAAGPHIVSQTISPAPHMVDIAPTILYALGEPVPTSMNGRVLELFEPEFMDDHPIQYTDPAEETKSSTQEVYLAEEAEGVRDRLRGLGYV
jgi:predicted AlkP superfamily phosphohydrolase/phosphomutase